MTRFPAINVPQNTPSPWLTSRQRHSLPSKMTHLRRPQRCRTPLRRRVAVQHSSGASGGSAVIHSGAAGAVPPSPRAIAFETFRVFTRHSWHFPPEVPFITVAKSRDSNRLSLESCGRRPHFGHWLGCRSSNAIALGRTCDGNKKLPISRNEMESEPPEAPLCRLVCRPV